VQNAGRKKKQRGNRVTKKVRNAGESQKKKKENTKKLTKSMLAKEKRGGGENSYPVLRHLKW